MLRLGSGRPRGTGSVRRRTRSSNCGDLTLSELRSLVSRASLFVGGDSGPLHVAATTDTAIVGLFGPTLAERSAPWRSRESITESVDAGTLPCRPCDQRRCVPGDFRCLRGCRRRWSPALPSARSSGGVVFPLGEPMTSTTIAAPVSTGIASRRRRFARWSASSAALQVSIAAAGILLGLTIACWATFVATRQERIEVPRMFWPLVAYAGRTIVSALFSSNPSLSLLDCKQLILFLIVPMVFGWRAAGGR